jgi:hypothetical protein
MVRFSGKVGFAETRETAPGVWEEFILERKYKGDVIRNARRWENGENLNSTLVVNNKISILADSYLYSYFFNVRYVEWMGTRWSVTNIEVNRPRLLLTIGGVYNGPQNQASDDS